MVPPLSLYQLVLSALVWVFLMLYYAWPNNRHAERSRLSPPTPSPYQRAREPKPFVALTYKPPCIRCEQEATHPRLLPPVPPTPVILTKRRPRQVDTSTRFCPHPGYAYRGWWGRGNLRANGHPSGSIGNTKPLFTLAHPPEPPSTPPAITPHHWEPPPSLRQSASWAALQVASRSPDGGGSERLVQTL